jgi:hypothetical protein
VVFRIPLFLFIPGTQGFTHHISVPGEYAHSSLKKGSLNGPQNKKWRFFLKRVEQF